MPIVCTVHALQPRLIDELQEHPASLADVIARSDTHRDLDRYWHAIHYLLSRFDAARPFRTLLDGGESMPQTGDGPVPSSRLISPMDTQTFWRQISEVDPETLEEFFDPEALDRDSIYPRRWVELSDELDLLGDVLEHYSSLQVIAKDAALERRGLLIHYARLGDETDE